MTAAEGPAAGAAATSGIDAAISGSLLDTLHDSTVRDLAWLLMSADLLRPQPPTGALAHPFETPQEAQATRGWLRALDAAPEPLHRDLAATRITRLGRYAERLLGWFLQYGPAARLVAAGVPLRRAGVTLGECDFLVQTQHGARLHWELAVKCYLHAGQRRAQLSNSRLSDLRLSDSQSSGSQSCEPRSSESQTSDPRLSDFVGPNLKDRFDLKLTHLLNHQLPLSAREEFASVGYAGPWTPQMFIKGWLFYRHDETPLSPAELDPSHGRGWWVTRGDWPVFAASQAAQWRALPRLEWLAPRRHTARDAAAMNLAFVDAETLAAKTAPPQGPLMVAAFDEDSAGNMVERSRGFIVPDEWPQLAQRYARQ